MESSQIPCIKPSPPTCAFFIFFFYNIINQGKVCNRRDLQILSFALTPICYLLWSLASNHLRNAVPHLYSHCCSAAHCPCARRFLRLHGKFSCPPSLRYSGFEARRPTNTTGPHKQRASPCHLGIPPDSPHVRPCPGHHVLPRNRRR